MGQVNDGFEQISTAKHMGRDFENYDCKLAMAGLAFSRWQKCITFTDDNANMAPTPSPAASREDTELVARLLGNISVAFEDAHVKAERYAVVEQAPLPVAAGSASGSAPVILVERTRARSKVYQKANGILNKIRWTFHDAEAFKKMVDSVDENVGKLVQLFPALAVQQQQLREADVRNIAPKDTDVQSEELLKLMETAAPTCDPGLVEEARRFYNDNVVMGDAKAHYGDLNETGAAVEGTDTGKYHYTKNVAKDQARALYGNRIVNGSSGFFD